MELTEFLLARIAEDEATVRGADRWERGLHTINCGTQLGYWGLPDCECYGPARILAECEAKRQVIRACTPASIDGVSLVDQTASAFYVLRALVSLFADHPDHRPEWRP